MPKKATQKTTQKAAPATTDQTLADKTSLKLNCSITVSQGDMTIAEIPQSITIPYALSDKNITDAQEQFTQLFSILVTQPLFNQVKEHLDSQITQNFGLSEISENSKHEETAKKKQPKDNIEFIDPEPEDEEYEPQGEDPE